jgi:predicted DNA-binding protein (UPF0251 family)
MNWQRQKRKSPAQKRKAAADWLEQDMLHVLDLVDNHGMTRLAAGATVGRSKGAVIGMLDRVRKETAEHWPPDTNDGTMPQRWWER